MLLPYFSYRLKRHLKRFYQIQEIHKILKEIKSLEERTKILIGNLSDPEITEEQKISCDEEYRIILSSIYQLNGELKEKTQLVKTIHNTLHTPPSA